MDAAQDTGELFAAVAALPAEGGTITLEAGRQYDALDERWLILGDRPAVIEGNGAIIASQAPGGSPIMPLGVGPIVWDAPYPLTKTTARTTHHDGHRIASAAAGASELVLLEPAPEGYYQPGDVLLVAGLIQQVNADDTEPWGWPPNFRWFEYPTIARVAGNVLQFAEPLHYAYDEQWPDLPQAIYGHDYRFGAPRVYRWRHDDGRRPNRSLTIRDVTFRGGSFGTSALHLRIERCTVETTSFWPTVAGRVEVIDTTLAGVELDKLCPSFLMAGGEVLQRASGGTGVLDVTFAGVHFHAFASFVARGPWAIDECQFDDGFHLATLGATNRREPIKVSATVEVA